LKSTYDLKCHEKEFEVIFIEKEYWSIFRVVSGSKTQRRFGPGYKTNTFGSTT
jgi:hypothetical protein